MPATVLLHRRSRAVGLETEEKEGRAADRVLTNGPSEGTDRHDVPRQVHGVGQVRNVVPGHGVNLLLPIKAGGHGVPAQLVPYLIEMRHPAVWTREGSHPATAHRPNVEQSTRESRAATRLATQGDRTIAAGEQVSHDDWVGAGREWTTKAPRQWTRSAVGSQCCIYCRSRCASSWGGERRATKHPGHVVAPPTRCQLQAGVAAIDPSLICIMSHHYFPPHPEGTHRSNVACPRSLATRGTLYRWLAWLALGRSFAQESGAPSLAGFLAWHNLPCVPSLCGL